MTLELVVNQDMVLGYVFNPSYKQVIITSLYTVTLFNVHDNPIKLASLSFPFYNQRNSKLSIFPKITHLVRESGNLKSFDFKANDLSPIPLNFQSNTAKQRFVLFKESELNDQNCRCLFSLKDQNFRI